MVAGGGGGGNRLAPQQQFGLGDPSYDAASAGSLALAPQDETSYNRLLDKAVRSKCLDEAWALIEDMQSKGIPADKFAVSRTLMKTVTDSRDWRRVSRGISIVERFIEMQRKDADEVLFNSLLDACCRLKDMMRLETSLRKMRRNNIQPSAVTLGILVKAYGQAGDMEKVTAVWKQMAPQRLQANAVTYGCMIDACVKCGHIDQAVEVFNEMKSHNKHRNTILYTTLIKGFGMTKNITAALNLFREMQAESVPCNNITYNSMIDVCVRCHHVTVAESVFEDMLKANLEPDLITFSTLIKGHCHAGNLDRALDFARQIKDRGLKCDELVYNSLLDGCVKAKDLTTGIGLFEEMKQEGVMPSAITYSIIVRLYKRSAYADQEAEKQVQMLYAQSGLQTPSEAQRHRSGRARAGGQGRGRGAGGFSRGGGGGRGGGGDHFINNDKNGLGDTPSSPATGTLNPGPDTPLALQDMDHPANARDMSSSQQMGAGPYPMVGMVNGNSGGYGVPDSSGSYSGNFSGGYGAPFPPHLAEGPGGRSHGAVASMSYRGMSGVPGPQTASASSEWTPFQTSTPVNMKGNPAANEQGGFLLGYDQMRLTPGSLYSPSQTGNSFSPTGSPSGNMSGAMSGLDGQGSPSGGQYGPGQQAFGGQFPMGRQFSGGMGFMAPVMTPGAQWEGGNLAIGGSYGLDASALYQNGDEALTSPVGY